MKIKNKHCETLVTGEAQRLYRRVKKALFGARNSKAQLRRRINGIIVTEHDYPFCATFDQPRFCHKCGCENFYSSGNRVSYPEIWETEYCSRCNTVTGEADNSPFVTELELLALNKIKCHNPNCYCRRRDGARNF